MKIIRRDFRFKYYAYPFDEMEMENDLHVSYSKENHEDISRLIQKIYPNNYIYFAKVKEFPGCFCIADYSNIDCLQFTRTLYVFKYIEEAEVELEKAISKGEKREVDRKEEIKERDDYEKNCIKNKGNGGMIIPHFTKKEKGILSALADTYINSLPGDLYDNLIKMAGGHRECHILSTKYTFNDVVRTAYINI